MVLLSFINNNRSNPNLVSLQNISLIDYKNMNYESKKKILGGIYENRPEISKEIKFTYGEHISRYKSKSK